MKRLEAPHPNPLLKEEREKRIPAPLIGSEQRVPSPLNGRG
jgi:hypothetical protein